MPEKPMRPCKNPFCRNKTDHFSGWCDKCYNPDVYRSKKRAKPERYDNPRDKYRWLKFSREYLKRNKLCVVCHRPAQVTDHVVPYELLIYDLGYDPIGEDEYYQAMCIRCNTQKGGADRAEIKAYCERRGITVDELMRAVYKLRYDQHMKNRQSGG
jgi:hypothetical protein